MSHNRNNLIGDRQLTRPQGSLWHKLMGTDTRQQETLPTTLATDSTQCIRLDIQSLWNLAYFKTSFDSFTRIEAKP